MHEPKFDVLSSKFRKPRTSDLEPSSVSPVPLFLSASNSELITQNSELPCPSRQSRSAILRETRDDYLFE
jgi:hypothetical protein